MKSTWPAIVILLSSLFSSNAPFVAVNRPPVNAEKTYEFKNGKWFDGRAFREKTFYSVASRLTTRRPKRNDETIDLGGGFVVPPFGDGHSHHFDSSYNIDEQVGMYLRDGVFYGAVQTD